MKTTKEIKSITALGKTFEVKKVLAMAVFGNDIDIEFEDERGNYHHYKSWADHGTVEWKD